MTLFPLLPKCWDCGPIPPCLHLNIVFPLKTTRISSTAFSSLLIQDLIFYASPPFLINQKLDWWHLVSMSFSVWLCDWSGLLGGQAKGSGLTLYSNGGAFGNGGAAGEWMWKCPMANQVISHTAAMCSVSALTLPTALAATLEVCHQATEWQKLNTRCGLEIKSPRVLLVSVWQCRHGKALPWEGWGVSDAPELPAPSEPETLPNIAC
jgi:hypothetical protein